ncbi:MAG: glycosyl transferase [Geminicoccaceae bacterium]|nr:glycosyl transferase [Geminicoccaceae bacterium]
MSPPRFFLWVQHLLGTGHLRRALLLGEALAARGARVLVASGGPPAGFPVPAGVELLELPPIVARDAAFSALVTPQGDPVDARCWTRRREALLAAFRAFDPDVLVVEHWPFGRSAFTAEVAALLDAARNRGARVVASVRDLLVSKADPAKFRRMLEHAARLDRILVHGDPALLPFAASFPLAHELGERLVHTGYLAPPPLAAAERSREILVSAGGGAVGERLCRVALEAARATTGRPWRIVTGPGLPAAVFESLRERAPAHVLVERQRPDLAALVARAAVSVSQAGYNTVVEALAGGTPMVLVPFAEGGEDEQTRRAQALAARGRAQLVSEAELSAGRLARAVEVALAEPPAAPLTIRLDGAARSAELLLELAR